MGNVRVLPLLVFAGLCLFCLKALGLLLSGSYVLSGVAPASAQNPPAAPAPAQQQSAAEQASQSEPSVEPAKPDEASVAKGDAAEPKKMAAAGDDAVTGKDKKKTRKKKLDPKKVDVTSVGPIGGTTKSELAVLEGLANRRKTLDQRAREIELQENLLKAAEKRVEGRITELKAIQSSIEGELKKSDDNRKAQYQRLVKMYSGMKPKDAARIFDRLEMNVLTGLVSQMKPRIMSAILAAMKPAAAERLTLEIANRGKPRIKSAASLPKIQSE